MKNVNIIRKGSQTEVIFSPVRVKLYGRFDYFPLFKIHLPNGLILEYVVNKDGKLLTNVFQLYGFRRKEKLIAVRNKIVSFEFIEKLQNVLGEKYES